MGWLLGDDMILDSTPLLCSPNRITLPDLYKSSSALPKTFSLKMASAGFGEEIFEKLQQSTRFIPPKLEVSHLFYNLFYLLHTEIQNRDLHM
jgi:hypothetical protein